MREILVFVTAGSEDEAKRLACAVVDEGVAACANIVPRICSIFRWEGQVTEEQECLLFIKTVDEVFADLERTIKTHHSYEIPEIIAVSIQRGSQDYLEWMKDAIKRPKSEAE